MIHKSVTDNIPLPITYLKYHYPKLTEIRNCLNIPSPKNNRIGSLVFFIIFFVLSAKVFSSIECTKNFSKPYHFFFFDNTILGKNQQF